MEFNKLAMPKFCKDILASRKTKKLPAINYGHQPEGDGTISAPPKKWISALHRVAPNQ